MRDFLRSGDHFIDVGLYSLLALSLVGPTGHVHAFEPNRQVAQSLLESLEISGINNATVHQVGVAEFTGRADFENTSNDCTGHVTTANPSSSASQIPVVRLDQHLDDVPYAMAKSDIEGYEPFAVRGASKWLKNGNPAVMLIEVAGYSKRHAITTSDFIDELHRNGYFTAVYSPDDQKLIQTARPWEIPVDNVLAIAMERQQFVEARLADHVSRTNS